MKERLETPDKKAELRGGLSVRPVCTLRDEHGGKTHITVDDGCYVLLEGSDENGYTWAYHWHQAAVEALKSLPCNPREAREQLGE